MSTDDVSLAINLLTTMLSAFLGAWAAFKLEAHREAQRERGRQLDAVRAALFALLMQRTFLRNLDAQHLSEHRDKPGRAYFLLPIDTTGTTATLNLASLSFLLGAGQGELLNRLNMTDERYHTVIATLARRNHAHLDLQPHLAASKERSGTLEDVRQIVGNLRARQVEDATEQLYAIHEDALAANRSTYAVLEKYTRAEFGKKSIFRVEDLPLGARAPT